MNTEDRWISIMDYAMKNDVSLSTIRRYIKSKKIPYKMEHGKYLLLDQPIQNRYNPAFPTLNHEPELEHRVTILEAKLNDALEQITELKMLLALYEDRIQTK